MGRLKKYVPDVSRSIFGILDGMRKRKAQDGDPRNKKKTKKKQLVPSKNAILQRMEKKEITLETIQQHLFWAIDDQLAGNHINDPTSNSGTSSGKIGRHDKSLEDEIAPEPFYLLPLVPK